MEIIMKALALFCYGAYADIYRIGFERELKKRFLSGENITCPSLTAKSNNYYRIRARLGRLEHELRRLIYAKQQNAARVFR